MKTPLIIAHGEDIVAVIVGLFGILAVSIGLIICGTVLCFRKKEAAKITGARMHKFGVVGLLSTVAALMWIFW